MLVFQTTLFTITSRKSCNALGIVRRYRELAKYNQEPTRPHHPQIVFNAYSVHDAAESHPGRLGRNRLF